MTYFIFLQYKIDCRVTIELLDTETDDPDKASVANTAKWSSYVEQLANPGTGGCNQSGTATSSNNTSSAQQRRSSSISTDAEIKKETLDVDLVSVHDWFQFFKSTQRHTSHTTHTLKPTNNLFSYFEYVSELENVFLCRVAVCVKFCVLVSFLFFEFVHLCETLVEVIYLYKCVCVGVDDNRLSYNFD